MSYEFVPVSTDEKAIKEIARLLRAAFPISNKFTEAFIDWQYNKNPDGKVVGYNAYKNGVLVAHYAVIPLKAKLFGKDENGLLSLNTATHPNHQGKKLFTTLAELTYKLAVDKGYSFVIGVANANSTPGFVNKLGFQLVGSLDAKLGFGKIVSSGKKNAVAFIKSWNKQSIEWRLTNPETKYKIKENFIYAATDTPGIEAILLTIPDTLQLPENKISIGFRPVKLWIGINKNYDWKKSFYFDVPFKFRPSPLNFIFKDLTLANRKLDINNVYFDAFDFDAY
jgi:predicted N-acetyltransferase YhbS